MIRLQLQCHPDSPRGEIAAIEATVAGHDAGGLMLCFAVTGDLGRLKLPPPRAAERVDELWRSTCCEVFIRNAEHKAYREYNFAPSEAWQAYDFSDYRHGRRLAAVAPPACSWSIGAERVQLCVHLRAEHLPAAPWRLNLAAVLEQRGLPLSYWALAHPAPHPDFHHPDAFVLELEPPC